MNGFRDSLVSMVIRAWAGKTLLRSRQGQEIFPNKPHNQSVPAALAMEEELPRGVANHSPPSSADVKCHGSNIATPAIRPRGVHRDNFTCTVLSTLIYR
jgi:hypothetical protein